MLSRLMQVSYRSVEGIGHTQMRMQVRAKGEQIAKVTDEHQAAQLRCSGVFI